MRSLIVLGLMLTNSTPAWPADPKALIKVLEKSDRVTKVGAFVPEPYEELPKGAKFGGLTKNGYQRCVQRIASSNRIFFRVQYLSGPFKVEGFLALPINFSTDKKYPIVIYNRGGNRDFGKLQACGLVVMNSLFEGDGKSILFAPQFRGTSGSEGKDEYGGSEISDVVSAYDLLLGYSFVDAKNKYMVGWSRGGMTSYLAMKKGLKFNAVAVLAGLPDLASVDQTRPDMKKVFDELIPNIQSDRRAALAERSANFWPEALSSPVLLLHGGKDAKAPLAPVVRLDQQLTSLRYPHRLIVYQESGHYFEGHERDLGREVQEWFKKFSTPALE